MHATPSLRATIDRRMISAAALAALVLGLVATAVQAAPFDHPWTIARHDQGTLAADLARLDAAAGAIPVWVYLTDKGITSDESYARARAAAEAALTPAARERRAQLGGAALVDYLDLPVRADHVQAIAATGAELRQTSRWLNAVSVNATPAELVRIAVLPMVARLAPVARGPRSPLPGPERTPETAGAAQVHILNYGQSLGQLDEIQVADVHDLGYSGAGVLVCMLDTGYYKQHEAFAPAISSGRLIAERDFINGDWNTQNEPGDPSTQHNHGTYTWSALGGQKPGQLYGPAFGATFAIGKTEDVADEQPIEEDFWLAGSEWADSLGARVISSSLGYLDWYTYEDMDGNTAVTTNAADIAASRNILVCTAAGNEGNSSWHYLIAPSDGDSVIACGAVDDANQVAGFSSWGPSYDGRMKPEVCARGVSTRCATTQSTTSYAGVSGTSLSTPLIGGAAALVMEARPAWTAMQVREALIRTADTVNNPDYRRGYGRIRVHDAINYTVVAIAPVAAPEVTPRLHVSPNPLAFPTAIALAVPAAGPLAVDLYAVGGRHVARLLDTRAAAGELRLSWDGRDANGVQVPAGVYLLRARGTGLDTQAKVVLAP